MTDAKVPDRAAGVGRLGTAAAWISADCCLPYLALKVVWTLDLPVGISDRSVLDSGGWVAGNALMTVLQLAGLLLVLALTRRPWNAGYRRGSSYSRCGWGPGCCSRSLSALCWSGCSRTSRRWWRRHPTRSCIATST
jgi:hypothetical protein